jgi:hypothetical protein
MRYALFGWLFFFQLSIGKAQATEAAQLLLNYEKLQQLEEILENMYKGYKILSEGYNKIKNIAEGNYDLHQIFLDGLFAVNPSVASYKRILDIINYQQLLMREYRTAYQRFRNDPNLTPSELKYILSVYDYLVDETLKNIEELTRVITVKELRMSDDERLKAIDRIFISMEDKLAFLRYFNSSTQVLAIQRAKEKGDVSTLRKLHSVEK